MPGRKIDRKEQAGQSKKSKGSAIRTQRPVTHHARNEKQKWGGQRNPPESRRNGPGICHANEQGPKSEAQVAKDKCGDAEAQMRLLP